MPTGRIICKHVALNRSVARVRSGRFFLLGSLVGAATVAKATSKQSVLSLILPNRVERSKVAEMMRESGRTVEEYESAREFLKRKALHRPGPVFVDGELTAVSAIELAQVLESEGHPFPCVVMARRTQSVVVLESGAELLLKPIKKESLLAAIDRCYNPEVFPMADLRWGLSRMSPRVVEVASLLVRGLNNKAIAASLGITVRTVESHRNSIMSKLFARDIPELRRKWKALQVMQ